MKIIKEKIVKVGLRVLLMVFVAILIATTITAGLVAKKTETALEKISLDGGGAKENFYRLLPFTDKALKGEKTGRINLLLLGMRGADDPNGGLLSDSEMIISLDLASNKIAMVSIPRDLYVDNAVYGAKTKLNAVYASAELKGSGQGIAVAQNKFSEIAGLPIDYTVVVNQHAFKDVVDSLGGVSIHLDTEFSESQQFMGEPKICNNSSYTIETGKFTKQRIKYKNDDGSIKYIKVRKAQLCYPTKASECGGNFKLESGDVTLSGDQALCFVRSRASSNDFERAKRQQLILQQIRTKLVTFGTLSDYEKISSLLNSLSQNVKSNLRPWEMIRLYSLYSKMNNSGQFSLIQRTLEDSEEGLLYWPGNIDGVGYVLLARGDNYERIHNLFANIFSQTPSN